MTDLERLLDGPRVTLRRAGPPDLDGDAVVYWMQRAQRASDNPALDLAVDAANALAKPCIVFFGLNPFVTRANLRHYQFLVEGLPDIADGLARRNVTFVLRRHPDHRLAPLLDEVRPVLVIGDENPLRQTERWRETLAESVRAPFHTVDADVIVPTLELPGEQYAARTIRPRIHKRLNEFLVTSHEPACRVAWTGSTPASLDPTDTSLLNGLPIDRSVSPVSGLRGGSGEGHLRLRAFVAHALHDYAIARNHPERDGTSQLSPYLHFGHLGPREVARAVSAADVSDDSKQALLEQLIVRRELATSFVRFNPRYDSMDGVEGWARLTLARHEKDARPHLYTEAQLDAGETHDPLWNAAQRQMVEAGWMHGYVRMYWAKKLLEWAPTAADALRVAIALNDRYELDGRDPNGYANIAWAIGGKHDRPWPARAVFGTVRSMTLASTRKKFDADAYIARWGGAK